MITEYKKHLDFYRNYWFADFSRYVPNDQWGNRTLAEIFMRKYWLPKDEYDSVWKPIQNRIFSKTARFEGDVVFKSPLFLTKIIDGGCLFDEKDLDKMQEILSHIGEQQFVVIMDSQDDSINENEEPSFRFKFPANIMWEELMSGNYISAVLVEMQFNNYFMFGQNEKWGKYIATDYLRSKDILGVNKDLYKEMYKQFFKT
jgi:hypothetical protein